jgi:ATP-dependent DNA ligase
MNTKTLTPTTQTYDFSHQVENHPAKYDGTEFGPFTVQNQAIRLAKFYVPNQELSQEETTQAIWDLALEQLAPVRQAIDDEREGMYVEFIAESLRQSLDEVIKEAHVDRICDLEMAKVPSTLDGYTFWNSQEQNWGKVYPYFDDKLERLVSEICSKYDALVK